MTWFAPYTWRYFLHTIGNFSSFCLNVMGGCPYLGIGNGVCPSNCFQVERLVDNDWTAYQTVWPGLKETLGNVLWILTLPWTGPWGLDHILVAVPLCNHPRTENGINIRWEEKKMAIAWRTKWVNVSKETVDKSHNNGLKQGGGPEEFYNSSRLIPRKF